MARKPGIDVKLELLNRSPRLIKAAMNNLAEALIGGVPDEVHAEKFKLGRLMGNVLALANVMGRKRTLMEADYTRPKHRAGDLFRDRSFGPWAFAAPVMFDIDYIFPDDAFQEALDDLITRDPRLARTGDEIRDVYSTGGFALRGITRDISDQAQKTLTRKIQMAMTKLASEGKTTNDAKKVLAEIGDFSEAYAQTVYRTNLATAFTAGRFKQLDDPDVKRVAPALEYEAVDDADVRPNHFAAKGLLANTDDAVWDIYSPPMGYNCRCDPRVVDVFELENRGLLLKNGRAKTVYPATFRKARPDPGFGNKGRVR